MAKTPEADYMWWRIYCVVSLGLVVWALVLIWSDPTPSPRPPELGQEDWPIVINDGEMPRYGTDPVTRNRFFLVSINLGNSSSTISSTDVMEKIHKLGLRPATLAELAAFAALYPDEGRQMPYDLTSSAALEYPPYDLTSSAALEYPDTIRREPRIVALGTARELDGDFACLIGRGREQRIVRLSRQRLWGPRYSDSNVRFAAVCK